MARGDAEMRIRIPEDIKKWLAEQAKLNCRTQASQIVFTLRSAMSGAKALDAESEN